MPYQPTQFNEGGPPGISAAELNKLGSQYGEVKGELEKPDGSSDIKPHGSNLVDGSVPLSKLETDVATQAELDAHKSATPLDHPDGAVTAGKLANGAVDTLTRIASGVRTTNGGREPNRLAVTNASGRVGDSERLGGLAPTAFAQPPLGINQLKTATGSARTSSRYEMREHPLGTPFTATLSPAPRQASNLRSFGRYGWEGRPQPRQHSCIGIGRTCSTRPGIP